MTADRAVALSRVGRRRISDRAGHAPAAGSKGTPLRREQSTQDGLVVNFNGRLRRAPSTYAIHSSFMRRNLTEGSNPVSWRSHRCCQTASLIRRCHHRRSRSRSVRHAGWPSKQGRIRDRIATPNAADYSPQNLQQAQGCRHRARWRNAPARAAAAQPRLFDPSAVGRHRLQARRDRGRRDLHRRQQKHAVEDVGSH